MTPKQKAVELVNKQSVSCSNNVRKHKANAALIELSLLINSTTDTKELNYLLEIKQEIQKI